MGSSVFTEKLKSIESDIKKIDSDIDKMSGDESALKYEKDKRTFADNGEPEQISQPIELNPEITNQQSGVTVIQPNEISKPEIVPIKSKMPLEEFKSKVFELAEDERTDLMQQYAIDVPELVTKEQQIKAVADLKAGKQTVGAVALEKAINEMHEKGIIAVKKGTGNAAERIEVPIEEWFANPLDAKELEALDRIDDGVLEMIKNEGITADNIDNLKHLFDGFPYTADDFATIKQFFTRKGEVNAATKDALDFGETKPTAEAGVGQPPTEPPVVEAGKGEQPDGIGITHAKMDEIAKELGLEPYEKNPETIAEWDAEAAKRISNGEMPELLSKMRRNEGIDKIEQRMMGQYVAELKSQIDKNPTNELINKLDEAKRLSNIVGGRETAKSLVARKGLFKPDETLSDALLNEKQALGVSELTEKQIESVTQEFNEIKKIRDDLAAKLQIAEAENVKLRAEAELKNIKKTASKSSDKKTHTDFVQERESLKDKLRKAKEKQEEFIKKQGINKAGFGNITLTTEMVSIIKDIVKSHLEEFGGKLEDISKKVLEEVREVFGDAVTQRDIINVIAGEHNEKKETRNQLVERVRDLKTEAQLLNKLDDVRRGQEPVTENKKTERNKRIKELNEKIADAQRRRKKYEELDENIVDNAVEGSTINLEGEKLANRRKNIEKRIEEIQKDVKEGRFGFSEPPARIQMDKTTQALQDRLIQLEEQQKIRRAKEDYENQHWLLKGLNTIYQIVGLKRFVGAAGDFSIPFRQASPITMNPFKIKTTIASFGDMFKNSFSPKRFKRTQYQLEKSDLGRLFIEFGGVFSNPTEIRMDKREEEFTNNIFRRIRNRIDDTGIKGLQKTADVIDKAWFSERAAASFLNTARAMEFATAIKSLRQDGFTPENSPQMYKDAVKWVMNKTGRGNMLGVLEDSHKGRLAANFTYFGARLMAAKMNMLNPIYYLKMPTQVRVQALKDMGGYVVGLGLTAAGLRAAGATISTNPDDADFLQARFGDKVYDITGGSASYVRTFLRIIKASAKLASAPDAKDTKSYAGFAWRSTVKSLFSNKLAPHVAYPYHFITGKSAEYNEAGKLKPFDPYEILEIYPMYADDVVKAWKEDGSQSLMTVFFPSIFGIGYQNYPNKKGGKSGGGGANGNY
jgi:hypothetical protein